MIGVRTGNHCSSECTEDNHFIAFHKLAKIGMRQESQKERRNQNKAQAVE